MQVVLTSHAFRRYRQRIDPTVDGGLIAAVLRGAVRHWRVVRQSARPGCWILREPWGFRPFECVAQINPDGTVVVITVLIPTSAYLYYQRRAA